MDWSHAIHAEPMWMLWQAMALGLTFILAAARTAVEAMDSTLDMEVSVLRLSDMAAWSPREAAVLIARGRVPKEDTCAEHARIPSLCHHDCDTRPED